MCQIPDARARLLSSACCLLSVRRPPPRQDAPLPRKTRSRDAVRSEAEFQALLGAMEEEVKKKSAVAGEGDRLVTPPPQLITPPPHLRHTSSLLITPPPRLPSMMVVIPVAEYEMERHIRVWSEGCWRSRVPCARG